MFDKFREECGIMAVWKNPEASNLAYLGLYAQQHRGQEGVGVVSIDQTDSGANFYVHRGLGLVSDVFGNFDFTRLPGDAALGHVRYTTAGGNLISNVQPFVAQISIGHVAVAHNGNLINANELRDELITQGAIFNSTSDTEVFLHLLARGRGTRPSAEAVIDAVAQARGAFSLVFLFNEMLVALRDPHGLRPLVIGTIGDGYTVASETCAFDLIGATFLRDVEPGEVVVISPEGELQSFKPFPKVEPAPCIFEHVYFARPDSNVYGKNVYQVRKQLGAELAKEHPVAADFVIAVPDSGVPAALGYSHASGIPLELGLIRNHYVGRTFIEPKQSIRDFGVKVKLNPNPELLKGKSVVVVDDSLVRGTTSKKLVGMLRAAGAKEVHFRVSSPPTTHSCYYGIDTPEQKQLIASDHTVEEIRQFIGVDSLAYLSSEGLYRAVNSTSPDSVGAPKSYCDACFSGRYPAGIPQEAHSRQRRLFPIVD